jgi:Arc/MetJ-type ribon-helix-helix transcriptional regulator
MGTGNQLAGSEEMKSPSFRIEASLLDAFDEWVAEDSRFDARSKVLREMIREKIEEEPGEETPLSPPTEERLSVAYKKLCEVANGDGMVRQDTAKRACSTGKAGMSKGEVLDIVLRPLERRGYLNRRSNIYATQDRDTAWELVGWEGR